MDIATTRRSVAFVDDLRRHGDAAALVHAGGELTYEELADRVERAAARLGTTRRLVAVAAANDVEPIVWYLAALHGGHPVLLLPDGDERRAGALVRSWDPDVVVGPGDGAWEPVERREGSAHRLHPDLALLLTTSGSTGAPKLVRLSHENVQSNADAIVEYLAIGPSDRAATTLPLHYCYGLSVLNSHLAAGAAVIVTDRSVVDPCFWDLFRAAGATSFAGVPYTFDLLDRIGFDQLSVPTLRTVTQAGGRLAPEQVTRYAELGERGGWDLVVMYGQTEATARMAYLPPHLARTHPGAIGVPVPGGSFRLDPVDGGEADELVYRGPNVMLGYAEELDDLAAGRTVHELRTGDLARRTRDGLYELVGRRSRFLKLFGLRVDLQHLEAVLAAHGIVGRCTGDDRGLAVAVTEGAAGEARAVIGEALAVPSGSVAVCEVDALPRLSNGKVDDVEVTRLARAGTAAAPSRPPEGDPDGVPAHERDGVRGLYAEVFGDAEIGDDATFVGLGGDSLSYVEVSIRLEDLLGSLPPGWHHLPVAELERSAAPKRRLKRVETNIVLRAVAIVMVVATHAGAIEQRGGAHVLLAVAGFNVARFQLGAGGRDGPSRRIVAAAWRIALPAVCWIAVLVAVTDGYGLANIVLANSHLGALEFDERWRYWFVEVLVQGLLVLAAVFAIPPVRRLERARPFAFAIGVVLLALAVRHGLVELLDARHRTVQPQTIFWVFALGWAAERARSVPQRLLVSALAVASVPGFFFGEAAREVLIVCGLLLLLWVPRLVVPRPVDRLLAPVAAASLFVYLTHWHVHPAVTDVSDPLVATVVSVLVGIAAWSAWQQLTKRFGELAGRRRGAVRAGHG